MALGHYILEGQEIKEVAFDEWALWFETANRAVDSSQVFGIQVSTVFLGIDHNFGQTMIFGGEYDQNCWRYATYEEAFEGHWKIVQCLKERKEPSLE